MKKDVQKQLAASEISIARSVGAAETRYHIASGQVEQTAKGRANDGKSMPRPVHEKEEITKINEIAVRNRDGQLLRYVYDQVKDKLLANPSPEALSRLKGHAVMAEMDMIRQGERLANAIQFGEFRQLPLKDLQGLHYTKSVREVSPRSALETVIRHFTDSAEQKREQKALTDILRQQLDRAQEQCAKASDYYSALNKMLDERCRAAGTWPKQIAPMLNSEQIAELRDYAEKQPYLSTARREFTDAAREAEQILHDREAAEAARQAEQSRANDLSSRTREQSESRSTQHSDRDSYSRGR